MGSTDQARVIGPKNHLHQVQQTLADLFTFLDHPLSSFLKRHADSRVVGGGAHDEIHLLHDAILDGNFVFSSGSSAGTNEISGSQLANHCDQRLLGSTGQLSGRNLPRAKSIDPTRHGHLAQRVHDLGDIDTPRAAGETLETRNAQPNGL
jgi:hypothetical protein